MRVLVTGGAKRLGAAIARAVAAAGHVPVIHYRSSRDEAEALAAALGGVAVPGDLPPEPSRAASMKTIPAPPPHRDPAMPGSRCQALLTQQQNGRAV